MRNDEEDSEERDKESKRKKRNSMGRIMSRVTEKQGMQDDRVPPDVNLECGRRPPAHSLNGGRRNTGLGKGGGTTRTERVTGIFFWEDSAEARDKPMSSGDRTMRGEPKLRFEGEETVTGGEVGEERGVGVSWAGMAFDDDGVALESDVTFVRGKEKGKTG
jgi:hypothetical protein